MKSITLQFQCPRAAFQATHHPRCLKAHAHLSGVGKSRNTNTRGVLHCKFSALERLLNRAGIPGAKLLQKSNVSGYAPSFPEFSLMKADSQELDVVEHGTSHQVESHNVESVFAT